MPVRFQRRIKIFPGVQLNLSKGGISVTVGFRGAHLTFNRHGIRHSVGLPGTGLSHQDYLVKYDKDKDDDGIPDSEERRRRAEERREARDGRDRLDDDQRELSRERRADDDDDGPEIGCFPWGCLGFILVVLVLGYWIGTATDLIPPDYLTTLWLQITEAIRQAWK